MDISDVELFNKIRTGDAGAFGELYARYKGSVISVLRRLRFPEGEIEDIAQEVFLDFYKRISDAKIQPTNFKSYICKTAQSKAMDYYRKPQQKSHPAPEEELDPKTPATVFTPEQTLEQKELNEKIKQTLRKLSEPYRQTIILKDIEGFSYEQIAQMLDIQLSTVSTRLMRARRAFMERYRGERSVTRDISKTLSKH